MDRQALQFTNIDEYIELFPPKVQEILRKLRAVIHSTAPDAIEAIRYGIPTFQLNGNLVHFAAYEHHIGFYPGASGIEHFKKELSDYVTSKGTVQFPIDRSIPYDLVEKVVRFRVEENLKRSKRK